MREMRDCHTFKNRYFSRQTVFNNATDILRKCSSLEYCLVYLNLNALHIFCIGVCYCKLAIRVNTPDPVSLRTIK